VLKLMFRKYNKTMEPACLHPVTATKYDDWTKEMSNAYKTRVARLDASALGGGSKRRKKRAAFAPLDYSNFCATLIPEVEFQGVLPLAGVLSKSQSCKCDEPSARFWKQLKYKVVYTEDIEDPAKDDFEKIKAEIEEKVRMNHAVGRRRLKF